MSEPVPLNHLGIICDGNRRWARERNLPTLEGHHQGAKTIELIIQELQKTEVHIVSFFVFSTENWDRTPEEINYLMKLIGDSIQKLSKKAEKENICVKILGREERVDPALWQSIKNVEERTSKNTGLIACFCFNYGGRWEIADAARKMHESGDTNFTPENFENYLYHPEVPACDLIVRTSGEERISGFQLYRAAYSEFYFIKKHFPAIEASDVHDFISEYHSRQRRFGK